MADRLKRELILRGLKITDSEINKLINLAVQDNNEKKSIPLFKEDKYYHYLILNTAILNACHELMYGIFQNKNMKQKLKRDFLVLKRNVEEFIKEFKKVHQQDTVLINAFESYSDDLTEMIYQHVDRINNHK